MRNSVSKTHKTAIVLIPPEEKWPSIQAIRQAHDRHYWRWMPHITLIYPFRPKGEWTPEIADLTRACADVQPFAVELARFACFAHRSSCTLWLAPEPQDALIQLQTTLWRVVPDCDEARQPASGFTPHLSVGQARGRERMKQLLDELQNTWSPIRFRASKVSLIWRNDPPDDVFRIGHEIRLGASLPHAP